MSLYRRNILVGVVVLGALISLAWMMAEFGGKLALPFAAPSLMVRFVSTRADGLSNGSAVNYRGVNVGRIERISRADDQLHVYIDASIDATPPLPSNLSATIRATGFIGTGAAIVLELTGPTPNGQLKADQKIDANFAGLDLIPPEFTELVGELRQTVKQFHDANLVAHVDEQVVKVGKLIDSINGIVADDKLRDDLRVSLTNIRDTTEKAKVVAANFNKIADDFDKLSTSTTSAVNDISKQTTAAVNDVSKQTLDRMTQISKVLEKVQAITDKVDNGQGTAGQLINDPRLYQSLVDTSRELNATVSDFKRLVEQWEQEGVSLKLK